MCCPRRPGCRRLSPGDYPSASDKADLQLVAEPAEELLALGDVGVGLDPERAGAVDDTEDRPALVGLSDRGITFVVEIETNGERIYTVSIVVNPDKLLKFPS